MTRLDNEQRSWLEETCQHYQDRAGEEALAYLNGRGLGMETMTAFRLGYVASPPPQHRAYEGRLAIPIIKRTGVTGFKFRCIKDHDCGEAGHPKFLTEGSQSIYNVTALDSPSKELDITEGEPDSWVLEFLGLTVIGLPGINAWKAHPWWKRLIAGFRVIRYWADNDAGKKKNYGREAGEKFCEEIPQAFMPQLPDPVGEEEKTDVGSVFLSHGPGYLMDLAGL